MPALTITDLSNGKKDLDHIQEVATSKNPTAIDRLGREKPTLQGAIDSIKSVNPRGAWASGAAYAAKDVVSVAGTWHICVLDHIAGATFAGDAAKWRVYQGVTQGDLSADGSSIVGHVPDLPGAAPTNLATLLNGLPVEVELFPGTDRHGALDSSAAFVAASMLGVPVICNGTYRLDSLPDNMDWRNFSGRGTATILGKAFNFSYIKTPKYDLEAIKAKIAIAQRSGIAAKLCVYTNSIGAGAGTPGYTSNPVDGAGNAIGNGAFRPPSAYSNILEDLFKVPGITVAQTVPPVAVWNASYAGRAISSGWFNVNYERAVIRNPDYGVPDVVFIGDSINSSYFGDPSPTNAALYRVELEKLVAKIQGYGSAVVLMEDPPIIAQLGFDYRVIKAGLDQIKKGFARERGLPFFDVANEIAKWYAMNDDLGSIATIPENTPALTQIYQQRGDRTHPGFETHRFIACYLMSKLAPNVWLADSNDEQVQSTDYRWFNQVMAAGAGTAFSGSIQCQNGALMYLQANNYNPNVAWQQALIWCPHKSAALVYRAGSRNGESASQRFITPAEAPEIFVRDLVSDNVIKSIPLPNDGVAMNGGLSGVDRPHVICSLTYGLNVVQLKSPKNNGYDFYPGGLQVVSDVAAPYPVATGIRSGKKIAHQQKNLLQRSGPIYVSNSGIANSVLNFATEDRKLENVVHFGQALKTTRLLLEVQLDAPTAIGIVSGPGWSGSLANPTSLRKVIGMLYRDSLAELKLVTATIDYAFNISFPSVLATGPYAKTGLQKIRIDLGRNAAGNQTIKVYDGWDSSTLVMNFESSNASPAAFEWAGYFGDVWIGASGATTSVHVDAAVAYFD